MDRRDINPSHSKNSRTANNGRGDEPTAAMSDARILVVTASRVQRDLLAAQLSGHVGELASVEDVESARQRLDDGRFTLVLIFVENDFEPARRLCEGRPGVPVMAIGETPSVEHAMLALRSGVVDIVSTKARGSELLLRVAAALRRGHEIRVRDERILRLRRLAKRLNEAREQISQSVGGLCTDLTNAYTDLSGKLTIVGAASEFNTVIRQELEIEGLLRAVLEFVLTKSGPTNAAIFLPASSGDFTLGAYVNYDGPKDSAEVLLDHLASGLAPKFEHSKGVEVMVGKGQIAARAGQVGDWVGDVTMVTFACHNADECLAVVTLFRDRRNSFPETLVPLLEVLSDLFAKQLARVVHVHHRHLPETKWGKSWEQSDTQDPDENLPDIDLAA